MKSYLATAIAAVIISLIFSGCTEDKANNEEKSSKEVVFPVEVMTVSKTKVTENAEFTGVIEARYSIDLIAEVSGKIEKVNKKLGSFVSKTDVIANIDDRIPEANFRQSEAQVFTAENNLRITQKNYNSDKELHKNGDISKLALDNSELVFKSAEATLLQAKAQLSIAKKTYDDTKIISPVAGYISREYVDLGTMVNIGSPVYRVVDLSVLKINIGVPQAMISRLKLGTKAKISIMSLNNAEISGHINFISPQADENAGTFVVEIGFPNNGQVKAGMTASVNLLIKSDEEEIAIPEYAIVKKDNIPYVYKIKGNRAMLTEVKLNGTYGQLIAVKDGLSQGDIVVVTGMQNLGVNTQIVIENKKQ